MTKSKGREYKLRRNAEKRLATLQAAFPGREFWVAPTQNFRFAVFTRRAISSNDPNAIAVICS
ncbi:MAG: hypothetical protein KGJ90_07055 [Patescibacteria group bacterium]|nr:hypothetical protein [Patescibacteria group bacterium]